MLQGNENENSLLERSLSALQKIECFCLFAESMSLMKRTDANTIFTAININTFIHSPLQMGFTDSHGMYEVSYYKCLQM